MGSHVNRSRLLVCSTVLFLSSVIAACGHIAAQSSPPSFTASIKIPTPTVAIGSTIQVDITLTNQTNSVLILDGLRSTPRRAGIKVWNSDGLELQPIPAVTDESSFLRSGFPTIVPPNRRITESINLIRWFDLSKQGNIPCNFKRKTLLLERLSSQIK